MTFLLCFDTFQNEKNREKEEKKSFFKQAKTSIDTKNELFPHTLRFLYPPSHPLKTMPKWKHSATEEEREKKNVQ